MSHFKDDEILYIIKRKTSEALPGDWVSVAADYNEEFDKDRSPECVKKCYHRYQNAFEDRNYEIDKLKQLARTKKNNSTMGRENRTILQVWNDREDILEAVSNVTKEMKNLKIPRLKPKKSSKKDHMTKELLLSDIHFGKKTDNFNLEVLKRMMKQVVHYTIAEIERDSVHYNIDRIVLGLLGDIIENYSMHAIESARNCEFGNARQVYESIKNLFELVMIPLHQTGIPITVVAITGNHDRDGKDRTYTNPGEENWTHVIYNALKDLCNAAGMKGIEFIIPKEPWVVIEIYGNKVLYEHYDNARSADRKGLEQLMTSRSNQLGINVDYMRGGHYHEPTSFRNGRIQINGCFPGPDSFSSVLGFNADPSQTLNSFVESSKRRFKLYKTFNIQLQYV